MRWISIAIIAIVVSFVLIFTFQNLQMVTVAFLNARVSAPQAVLIATVYLLGMITGGSVWALVRRAVERLRSR